MHLATISFLALCAVSSVSGHGVMTSPTPRAVGGATTAACGSSVAAIIKGDPTSHVEGLPEAAATDSGFDASKCNLFLCKGLQFADNKANVVALTAGQSLELKFIIPIPHKGPCNVSVVDTKTNTLIGGPLISFDSYADESLPVLPKNNTDMTVTIPTTLGSKCAVAGDCVIQWFWFGTAADQTYESCLDFTLADTSSGGTGSASSVSQTTSASTTETSSTAVTTVSATSSSSGAGSTTLGTTPLPTVSVTAGSSVSKSSSTATETSGKKSKSSSKSTSSTSTAASLAGTTTTTSSATAATVSSNTGNELSSKLFTFGNLKTVAAWLVAAELALVMME